MRSGDTPPDTRNAWVWRLIEALDGDPDALLWLAHAVWTTRPLAIAGDELRAIEDEIADRLVAHGRSRPVLPGRPSAFGASGD